MKLAVPPYLRAISEITRSFDSKMSTIRCHTKPIQIWGRVHCRSTTVLTKAAFLNSYHLLRDPRNCSEDTRRTLGYRLFQLRVSLFVVFMHGDNNYVQQLRDLCSTRCARAKCQRLNGASELDSAISIYVQWPAALQTSLLFPTYLRIVTVSIIVMDKYCVYMDGKSPLSSYRWF